MLEHCTKRYAAIASTIGYTVSMSDVLSATTCQDILNFVASTIDQSKTTKG